MDRVEGQRQDEAGSGGDRSRGVGIWRRAL